MLGCTLATSPGSTTAVEYEKEAPTTVFDVHEHVAEAAPGKESRVEQGKDLGVEMTVAALSVIESKVQTNESPSLENWQEVKDGGTGSIVWG